VDTIDVIKDNFYDELDSVFNKFPVKVPKEKNFNPPAGNEALHNISNDNGVRAVKFATSNILTIESTMFSHRNIHKHAWTSPDGENSYKIGQILTYRRRHSSVLNVRSVSAEDCDTDHYLVVAAVRETCSE
jgi:hypothetical protein